MQMTRPFIMLTNDDSIHAPGIRYLIKVMRSIGSVMVIAPDKPRSGMGHAITMDTPLRLKKLVDEPDFVEFKCNGTPADSVKLGLSLCKDYKPDIIISGLNHGANSSVNIIYSGTMAAAIEGAVDGIPSIGFSCINSSTTLDFSPFTSFIKSITLAVLNNQHEYPICLNVNLPDIANVELKGYKLCRQAKAMYQEQIEKRSDPHGKNYYWLTGSFINLEPDAMDTDEWALKNGYISVVPIQVDMTDYKLLNTIKNWEI